jgi:hypothetical protein
MTRDLPKGHPREEARQEYEAALNLLHGARKAAEAGRAERDAAEARRQASIAGVLIADALALLEKRQ